VSDLFDQYLQKFDELKDMMLDSFIRRNTFVEKSLLSKLSISDYLKKNNQTHFSKEEVRVTLDKEIVDKLKTVVIDSNITMSKLFENLLTPLLEDVKAKEKNIEIYNNKNKLKGRRKSE
jgi:hypothetical protein